MTSSALACFNAACSHILRAPKPYLHFTIGCGKQELYHRVLFKKSQFCELLCCTCTKMSRHIEFAMQSGWRSGHARVACFPKLLHEFLKMEVSQRKTCTGRKMLVGLMICLVQDRIRGVGKHAIMDSAHTLHFSWWFMPWVL